MLIRAMIQADLPAVRRLVETTEGLAFKFWETDAVLTRLLDRCDGLSQVAIDDSENVVGAVFIGEGLMAFVHHLAVKPDARGYGLGTKLVRAGLSSLYRQANGAKRVYITVLSTNTVAQSFWMKFGASLQASGTLVLFTMDLGSQEWLNEQQPVCSLKVA